MPLGLPKYCMIDIVFATLVDGKGRDETNGRRTRALPLLGSSVRLTARRGARYEISILILRTKSCNGWHQVALC